MLNTIPQDCPLVKQLESAAASYGPKAEIAAIFLAFLGYFDGSRVPALNDLRDFARGDLERRGASLAGDALITCGECRYWKECEAGRAITGCR